MLSVENPPRDPPPPCETGSDDEAEPVDLLNSADLLRDNQLPKFSIRDYVFSARSKDITKNWPFSQEKLQVCLKHGVTQVLPPFQKLDALREDPSQVKCNARLVDDPQRPSNSDGKKKLYRPRSDDEFVFVDSNVGFDENKLVVVSGSQDFPSTTTTQSCSDADSAALPTKKTPPFGSEPTNNNQDNNNNNNTTTTLQEKEQFVEKSEAVIPPPKSKPEGGVKKCKFIVKLSNLGHSAGAKEKEDNTTAMNNSYMLSEAMASKVCPVCKTFSSSSNTTLNAHIDQCLCLSGGDSAATKWPGDSRVINKHRIKPQKKRSMADIYETALRCTLEELDRRNGTNWASNSSSLPAAAQETKHDDDDGGGGRSSPPLNSDDEETHNQSAVYIDANGTKLRILSKFNDPSSDSKSSDDPRPSRRLLKGGKFLLAKKKNKKNHHFQKELKLSKHDAPLGKKICTSDPVPTAQIDKDQDRNFSCENNYVSQQLKALDKVKFSKPELIKGWACSKRTGLTKKINGRDDHLHSGGNNANREMQPENNQLSLSTNVKKSSLAKSRPETSPSPSNSKRIDNSSHEADHEYGDHPSPKKRFGFSSVESHGCCNKKRSFMVEEFPERSPKHLKQHDGKRRMIEVKSGTPRNVEHSVISPKMSSSSSPRELMSKSKFLFLKKRALSAADGRASGFDSKFYSKRKCSAVKKSRMQYLSEANQKVVVSPTRVDRHFMQSPSKKQASVEGSSSEECIERTRTRDMKIRDEIDSEEEEVSHKNSPSPITRHHDVGENSGSLMLSGAFGSTSASDGRESAGKSESAAACRRDINIELLPSEETVVGTFTDFSKTLDPRFNDGVEDDPRDMQCDSEQYIEAYKGPTSSGEQEMFCTDVVGGDENMMGKDACEIVELDSSNGQGSNYFGEVDSIPIPGPPGSFLPSPGRMDAENIPGMSSLSSNRIQSSDGHHQELIDHSSESPISTISNSTLGRYDVKSSSENVSGGSPLVDQLRSSDGSTNVVDNSAASGTRGVAEKEASFRYKNDQQPCCCSRKEIMSTQNVALNYHDSALLRRRTMAGAAASAPSSGKQQMNSSDNGNERNPVPEEARSSSSSMGQISSRVSSVPPPAAGHGNYESISPPTPNPVLRLMGKNLVVNKEENMDSQQLRRTSQSSSTTTTTTTNIHENSKAAPIPMMMVSTGRSQNEQEEHHNMVSQGGRFFYDQSETKEGIMQHPDMMMMMRWSTGFGSHQMAASRNSTGRGLTTTSTGGGYHTPIQHLQPSRIPMKYDDDMEKAAHENPVGRWRRKGSLDLQENTMKEIIVIDDTPPTTSYQQSRRSSGWSLNPFYMNQPSYESLASSYTGPGTAVNPSFRIGTNANLNPNPNVMRWNCNPEGGDVVHHYHNVHPSSLAAAAAAAATSSPARMRSELYNSSAGF